MEEEKVLKINTGVTETWPLIRVFPQAFREGLLVCLEKLILKHLYIDTRLDLVLVKEMVE